MAEKKLCQCNSGCTGIITTIKGETQTLSRLQEIGLLTGQWITIIRAGNPTIFEINESRYCIRANQLEGISVQIIPDGPHSTSCKTRLTLSNEISPIHTAHSEN